MRQYRGGGGRGPWIGEEPKPFQRADGTQMTQEEITRVTSGLPAQPPKRQPVSDADLEQVWQLVSEVGQADAARQLGLTQAGVQYRLSAYMKRNGLGGELPGTLTKDQREARASAARLLNAKTEETAHEDTIVEVSSERVDAAAEELPPPLAEAREAIVRTREEAAVQTVPETPTQVIVVQHQDGEARAAAFNEGYDQAVADYTPPKAIDALIDWLAENGPTWTPDAAARWFAAFNATVNLIYPSGYES